MKISDLILEYFPAIPPEEIRDFAWCCTCFPFQGTDVELLRKQLKELSEKAGGDYMKALVISDEEMNQAFEQYQKNESSCSASL